MTLKLKTLFLLSLLLVSLLYVAVQIPEVSGQGGTVITVDDTPTDPRAVSWSFQRKSFFAHGYYWLFYSDGTDVVFKTVDDATGNVSDAITVKTGYDYGWKFSIWFDGTRVHFAGAGAGPGDSMYYKRGTPNLDRTITWETEQIALQQTSLQIYYPFISVDSGGYPWIGFMNLTDSTDQPYVTKSSTNNGTWTTASGFPYLLKPTSKPTWGVAPIPLTNERVLVLYASGSNDYLYGKRWNGSAWAAQVNSDYELSNAFSYSAVAVGDDVNIVLLSDLSPGDNSIFHRKYTYSTNAIGSVATVIVNQTATSNPVLVNDTESGNLYTFWMNNSHIFYKKYNGTDWDTSATDWIDESTDGFPIDNQRIISTYKDYDSMIGISYITKTSSPYKVKFKSLSYKLNLRAKDVDGDIIEDATVYGDDVYGTTDSNGWKNFTFIPGSVISVRVKLQDLWVNGTFSVTIDADKTIDIDCKVYSLTVYITSGEGTPYEGADLSLSRNGTSLNGLYGLDAFPKTSLYNTSHSYYVWNQLANQSSSYTVEASITGVDLGTTTTSLTSNTEVLITYETGGVGAPGGPSKPPPPFYNASKVAKRVGIPVWVAEKLPWVVIGGIVLIISFPVFVVKKEKKKRKNRLSFFDRKPRRKKWD